MSKNLIPAQRRKLIQEYLASHKIASIADLSAMAETSEATIRRDLEWQPRVEVKEGIRRLYDWVVANRHLFEPLQSES